MDTNNELQIAKGILKKFLVGEFIGEHEIISVFPDLQEPVDEKTWRDLRLLVEAFAQGKDKKRFLSWLDRAHKVPAWKPSEEEINTLTKVCSNLHLKNSPDAKVVDELLEKLKAIDYFNT